MRAIQRLTALVVAGCAALAVGACDRQPVSPDSAAALDRASAPVAEAVTCQPTGTGLSAVVINQSVIDQTVDAAGCDVGIFLDEDGHVVRDATVEGGGPDAPAEQFGVRVHGASASVVNSTFLAPDDAGGQLIQIAYVEGATGKVAGNRLEGRHRTAVLLRGNGTSATVRDNEVVGVGPITNGWAENGIQVDQGAGGTIKGNLVKDHWYAPNTFQSAGVLVFADDVVVGHNEVLDNDMGIAVAGDRNTVLHNEVAAGYTDQETSTFHYGVYLVDGRNNGVRQNTITTESATYGLYGLIVVGDNTKLIRNDISGWATPILNAGTDTKLPPPFDPYD